MAAVICTRRSLGGRLAGAVAYLLVAVFGSASAAPASAPAADDVLLCGEERELWLVHNDANGAALFERTKSTAFRRTGLLNQPVRIGVAARGTVYVFLRDGGCYSAASDGWQRERDLPERALPVALAGSETDLWAAVSRSAGAPALYSNDGRDWQRVGALPPEVSGAALAAHQAALAVLDGKLLLVEAGADGVRMRRLGADGQWGSPERVSAQPATRVWAVTLSRIPTFLVSTDATPNTLAALRNLGGADDAEPWRATALTWAQPEAVAQRTSLHEVVDFNQHVAALTTAADGGLWLDFARPEPPVAEKPQSVATILAGPGIAARSRLWLQSATIFVLFAVLMALMLLRRNALAQELTLPAPYGVALTFQRMVGFVIDFLPVAFVVGMTLGVDVRAAAREMLNWALSSDPSAGHMPPTRTLLWWGTTVLAYVTYVTVAELATRRTLGKWVTRTEILTEGGQRASVGQLIVRNLFRILELQPTLWPLGLLVLLSRNRQRVGDVFARTVVVRHVLLPPASGSDDRHIDDSA